MKSCWEEARLKSSKLPRSKGNTMAPHRNPEALVCLGVGASLSTSHLKPPHWLFSDCVSHILIKLSVIQRCFSYHLKLKMSVHMKEWNYFYQSNGSSGRWGLSWMWGEMKVKAETPQRREGRPWRAGPEGRSSLRNLVLSTCIFTFCLVTDPESTFSCFSLTKLPPAWLLPRSHFYSSRVNSSTGRSSTTQHSKYLSGSISITSGDITKPYFKRLFFDMILSKEVCYLLFSVSLYIFMILEISLTVKK